MTSILPVLYSALEKRYGDRNRGVECHVSDLALCPREAVHRRLSPKKIDNVQLGFFIFGESAGTAIQALVDSDPERWKAEHEIIWEGVHAHVDLYDAKNNIPIEVKTANMADMEQPKAHYTSQLRIYQALLNAQQGIILAFLTQHFKGKVRDQPFREWVISMTPEQLEAERARIRTERDGFTKALEAKDPMLARGVINDPDMNWKCTRYCPLLVKCQALQKGAGK